MLRIRCRRYSNVYALKDVWKMISNSEDLVSQYQSERYEFWADVAVVQSDSGVIGSNLVITNRQLSQPADNITREHV